jgi:hypothetical protein
MSPSEGCPRSSERQVQEVGPALLSSESMEPEQLIEKIQEQFAKLDEVIVS